MHSQSNQTEKSTQFEFENDTIGNLKREWSLEYYQEYQVPNQSIKGTSVIVNCCMS